MEAVRLDASIEIFMAVMSSGSIAAWVIWSNAQFVWASLIAFSQFINAIKPYLPYQKRIRNLEVLKQELDELLLRMEHQWYSVSEGNLTNQEIHDIIIEIKREKTKKLNFYLSPNPLPTNRKYLVQAEQKATSYIERNYLSAESKENG